MDETSLRISQVELCLVFFVVEDGVDPLDKLTFILVCLLHHLPETRNDDVLDLVDLVRIPLPQPFEHVVHVDEGATVLVENVMHGEVRVEYEELD